MSTFGETLGLLKDDVGDTNMTVGRLVEGGGDDLSLHAALHVGDLLGTLVDKEHHKVDLRMVEGNGIGHLLEEGGLTGLRLCHNKTTLTFSYRGKKINDTRGKSLLRMTRELEFLIGEKRREALKRNAVANTVGSEAIDAEQLDKDEELVGLTGRTYHAANCVTGLQTIVANLLGTDIDIVGRSEVVVVAGTQEAVAVRYNLQHTLSLHDTFALKEVFTVSIALFLLLLLLRRIGLHILFRLLLG